MCGCNGVAEKRVLGRAYLERESMGSWTCIVWFMSGVTSWKTASMDSTKSNPVALRTSSSVMG
jgi:hypothetical protein